MSDVSVYVIHNAIEARNNYLFPLAESLPIALASRSVSVKKIGYQPPLSFAASRRFMFLEQSLYDYAAKASAHYRRMAKARSANRWPPIRAKSMFGMIRNALATAKSHDAALVREYQIKLALTDKHVRAFAGFLDGESDFMIIFEDDVVFKEDSVPKLDLLLSKAEETDPSRYIFIDLAGGFRIEQLDVHNLSIGADMEHPFIHYFTKMVGNTTCAYLVNRALIEKLYGVLLQRPELRRVTIGWLLLTLAFLAKADIERYRGLYILTEPTVFDHGTSVGAYQSSIDSMFI